MINIWHILIFLTFNTVTLFAAFYSGFYFGWMGKKGSPPARIPFVSTFEEILEGAKKERPRERIEEEEKENTFMA